MLATARDTLSAIASAEVQVDSGLWQPLTAAATPNTYQGTLMLLTEGDHALRVRARDSWSNLATSSDVAFHIDRARPVISITGVSDSAFYNHAVTPAIAVTDASPITLQEAALDSNAYISGTAVTAEGTHVLHVHALDAAGNEAMHDVTFTIDTTAPQVAFTAPPDNAVIVTANVDLTGTTEAYATVTIDVGTFTGQTQADAQGAFALAAVPLQSGPNAIRARATDRAGNVGAWAQVNVTSQAAAATSCQGFVLGGIFANGFETSGGSVLDYLFCDGFELP